VMLATVFVVWRLVLFVKFGSFVPLVFGVTVGDMVGVGVTVGVRVGVGLVDLLNSS